MTFIDACLAGDAQPADIDDWVEKWHLGDDPRELHEFLGFTWDEYAAWLTDPASVAATLEARKAPR